MKKFLGDDWLLDSEVAMTLYYDYAQKMPIADYHCHLPPDQILSNKRFKNITEAWLYGDHYKWRAMRANGIDETYITGEGSDEDKFLKWAETVPYTMRNPLYHWTHLELQRYFGISELLSKDSAKEVFEKTNSALEGADLTTQGMLKKMNVKMVGTTDDPIDSLEFHAQIEESPFDVMVTPSFRPDKSIAFENPESYNNYLDKLGEASGIEISKLSDLIEALDSRMDHFDSQGCRASDHGLNHVSFRRASLSENENSFSKVRSGKELTVDESEALKTYVLLELGKGYHKRGWAQQFHLGALRNTNRRALRELGPDTGYDSIGDFSQAENLSKLLDELNNTNQLAKTILYNLNPRDNEVFATMTGNYNEGSMPGKMQFGSGWWFLDQKGGMIKQINALSNMGLLSRFIGMLTDSRSFLSFPRHEYFRRILCNIVAQDVVNGELPNDVQWLGEMIENICYNNAADYFGLD